MYKQLGFVTVFILIYLKTSLLLKVKEIHFSKRCHGYNFKTVWKTSLSVCVQKCFYKVQCESINFNRLRKVCELNSVSGSDCVRPQVAAGWIFSDKSTWFNYNANQCQGYLCNQTETCIEKGEHFECRLEECKVKTEIKNGTVLGNMNSIGSVIAFMCNTDFTLIGLNSSVCDESGQWTFISETRCELLCPPLSSFLGLEITEAYLNTAEGIRYITALDASNISSLVAMQGSNVTYRCILEPYLIGNPVSTCVNGEWLQSISCIDKCPDYKRYSYSLYECVAVESCSNGFADTFVRYNATLLLNSADVIVTNVSEHNCLASCMSDQQCSSFDYWSALNKCYIQRQQHVDISAFRTYLSARSHYHRNCN